MSADLSVLDRFMGALTQLTAMAVMRPLSEEGRAKLKQDLPRGEVKTRSQANQTLSYVDGRYVIERLNEVFGHDGWSVEYGIPIVIQGDRPVIYVQVTLRAMGVTRGDVGVGLAAKNAGDALETAIKAAFTDGLKRAARTLGASVGLALYDKNQNDVGYSFETQEILAAYDAATTADDIEAANGRVRKAWQRLPAEERNAITGAKKLAEQRVSPAATNGASAADRAAQQPVTNDDALVSALKNALSVDHLLAVMLAHGGQTSDRVWTAAVRCAGALDGTTEEQLRADIAGRQSVAKAPEWGTVATFLGDVLKAVEIGGVDGAVTRHSVAIKALPEKLQRLCTSTAIFHRMTLRVGAANDAATLKQVHTNLESFVKGGKLGRAQAEVITNLLNDRATKLEALAAQNSAAACEGRPFARPQVTR